MQDHSYLLPVTDKRNEGKESFESVALANTMRILYWIFFIILHVNGTQTNLREKSNKIISKITKKNGFLSLICLVNFECQLYIKLKFINDLMIQFPQSNSRCSAWSSSPTTSAPAAAPPPPWAPATPPQSALAGLKYFLSMKYFCLLKYFY